MSLADNPTPSDVGTGSYYFDSAGGYQQSNIGYTDPISLSSVETTSILTLSGINVNNPVTGLNNISILGVQSLSSVETTSILTLAVIRANNPVTGFGSDGIDPKILQYQMAFAV